MGSNIQYLHYVHNPLSHTHTHTPIQNSHVHLKFSYVSNEQQEHNNNNPKMIKGDKMMLTKTGPSVLTCMKTLV